jgi:hypothetical protein
LVAGLHALSLSGESRSEVLAYAAHVSRADRAEPEGFDGATPLTSAERRAYEQECLVQVRAFLENIEASPHDQFEVISCELEGQHPETRIRVVLLDHRYPKERSGSYELWRSARTGEPEFLGYERRRADPQTVGLLISTWATGG